MTTPSIDMVAEAAGVHRSTVSRAFSRPEAVKAETREHILRVAESLGYTMSPLAQALRRKTSNLVPLIVPDITNPFFAELAKTMTTAAGEAGYQLLLCVTDGDSTRTENYLTSMNAMYAPFGVIAPSTRFDVDALRQFAFWSRVVVIDRMDDDPSVPTVTVDSARGIQLAAGHLAELGHRRIAYLAGISGTHTAQDRRQAYLRLMADSGSRPVILDGGVGSAASERAVDDYLALDERPTAIIAANDMLAFGLMSALGARGIRVPEDVSIVGFDGLALGESFNPALTTVRQPIADMGAIAIELAQSLILGEVGHRVLAPELLVRRSTAVPRS
jgi:DNA-binding LacI/PurR family transcriptional regulator